MCAVVVTVTRQESAEEEDAANLVITEANFAPEAPQPGRVDRGGYPLQNPDFFAGPAMIPAGHSEFG